MRRCPTQASPAGSKADQTESSCPEGPLGSRPAKPEPPRRSPPDGRPKQPASHNGKPASPPALAKPNPSLPTGTRLVASHSISRLPRQTHQPSSPGEAVPEPPRPAANQNNQPATTPTPPAPAKPKPEPGRERPTPPPRPTAAQREQTPSPHHRQPGHQPQQPTQPRPSRSAAAERPPRSPNPKKRHKPR